MDFTDKVVLITGASSGIGATCALHFARYSAKLSIVGRNEEKLKEVAKQCKAMKGIAPLIVKADLNVDADVKRVVHDTVNTYGRIDVLINNAGIGGPASLSDGIGLYDATMSANLRSVYLLTSLAINHIIMATGTIVNISSAASVKPFPEYLPYCMSKAAIDMFTKCLAKEYAVDSVRVNSVNPGPVKTNILEAAGMNDAEMAAYFKERLSDMPLGKISTTDEVADLVTFLASDKAKSITGCAYFMENGLLLGQ